MKHYYSKITTTQLAQICKVSQGTVDRALNDRPGIKPETKERVLKAAKEYGYLPNVHARSLAGGRSMLLGIVVFDLYNEYFAKLIMEMEKACREVGYSAVVMFSNQDLEQEKNCIHALYHLGVDGLVLCPLGQGQEYEAFLRSIPLKTVTVGNRMEGFDYAGIDDFQAMADSARYVLDNTDGCMIYFSPPLLKRGAVNISAQEQRYQGFLSVAAGSGRPYFVETQMQGLLDIAEKQHPATIVCSTDYHALQVYQEMTKRYTVPGQVGIMGFDQITLLQSLCIELATVGYSMESIARAAVRIGVQNGGEEGPISHFVVPGFSVGKESHSLPGRDAKKN